MTITPDEAAATAFVEPAEDPEAENVPQIDIAAIRELAMVTDMLRAREGEVEDLKARKRVLSAQLLPAFELNGLDQMRVDGRPVYVFNATYPKYQEKPVSEGGGKYTAQDAVAALREIGRGAQVQPETVNYQTMGAILREYRDQNQPIPEALAKFVTLGEAPEVRVGAARKNS